MPRYWHAGGARIIVEAGTRDADEGCGRSDTDRAGDTWIEKPHEIPRNLDHGSGPRSPGRLPGGATVARPRTLHFETPRQP